MALFSFLSFIHTSLFYCTHSKDEQSQYLNVLLHRTGCTPYISQDFIFFEGSFLLLFRVESQILLSFMENIYFHFFLGTSNFSLAGIFSL